jgi:hypothetical protein
LIVDPTERAEALIDLLPILSASHRQETLDEALSIARTRGAQPRVRLLLRLVPLLPEGERPALIQETLTQAQQIGVNTDRAKALADLLPWLPLDQQQAARREAVEAAQAENAETDRGQAWARLWPYLSEVESSAVLQRVQNYTDPFARASAALQLAQAVAGEAQRATLLDEADSAAALITDSTANGVHLWLALMRHSTPLSELVRTTAQQDARLLRFLCEHLPADTPADTLQNILKPIESLADDENRSHALAALLPRLSVPDRKRVAADLIEKLPALPSNRQRSDLARDLAPHLTAAQVRRVADFVRSNNDQAESLARVARFARLLPQAAVHELQAIVVTGREARWRTGALIDLAPNLPEPQRAQATAAALEGLAAIQYQPDWIDHAMALMYLIEAQQQGEALNWVLQAILQLPPGSLQQTQDLACLLPHLDVTSRQNLTAQMIQAVWGKANTQRDFTNWSNSLKQLSPYLSLDLARAIYEAAPQIDDLGWRLITLLHMAPHLAELERVRAIEEANALALTVDFTEPQLRATLPLLATLSQATQQRLFTLALAAARETPRLQTRSLSLAEVAAAAPEDDRPAIMVETLAAARLAESPQALVKLIPLLPDLDRQSVIHEAIAFAREVRSSGWRTAALVDLAESWAALPLEMIVQAWRDTLPVLSGYPRTEFLADCATLKPVVEALGGSEVAAELSSATQQVLRWWP